MKKKAKIVIKGKELNSGVTEITTIITGDENFGVAQMFIGCINILRDKGKSIKDIQNDVKKVYGMTSDTEKEMENK